MSDFIPSLGRTVYENMHYAITIGTQQIYSASGIPTEVVYLYHITNKSTHVLEHKEFSMCLAMVWAQQSSEGLIALAEMQNKQNKPVYSKPLLN